MRIRIGQIPYLNSEVFYYGMSREDVELVPLVPSALSAAAAQGQVDAGPIPLVACFELESRFQPLGDYCIATVERARSILLFSNRPIEELGGAVVGVTGETSTSVLLLKALLTHRFQVEPHRYAPLEEPADAFLLIGDEALRSRQGAPSHPHWYDLGQEWHRWTGLSFVFARWMVRRDLEPEAVERLADLLNSSVDMGLGNVDAIAKKRRDLGMSHAEVTEYVRSFRYRLGPEELSSIDLFRELLAREVVPSPLAEEGQARRRSRLST